MGRHARRRFPWALVSALNPADISGVFATAMWSVAPQPPK